MAGTELAKAYVQIIPSADGIKGKLTSALSGEASSAGDSAGKTAGASLGSAIKKVIAAAGIGAALKSALSEGADLQQSLGGIETLFKDSADKVIANARNAYMTAGLSANEYMESVTSFSASLLQGLAGDTNKAADVADMALTDMSDNANKMGTSMELIQNAYQGFAKQNYTMLDNLKLGYGGTKTEMQRLLADAQKLTGVKYDMDNLSDVYEAIHVIQEEMGITGTTAKEAASTFSGSLASMKSAFSNVLGNLTLGEDIKPSLMALEDTVFTFVKDNLLPMVGNIMSGLPDILKSGFSMALRGINFVADNADVLVQNGIELAKGIVSGVSAAKIQIAEAAISIATELWNTLVNTDWLTVATDVVTRIGSNISTVAGEILGVDTSIVDAMTASIVEQLPVIFETITTAFQTLWDTCKAVWETYGQPIWDGIVLAVNYVAENWSTISAIISGAFQTLWDMCKTIWESVGKPIWDMIVFAVMETMGFFAQHMPAIMGFFQTAIAGIKDTWNNHLKPVFEAIGDYLNNTIKPAFEFVWKTIIEPLVATVFDGIKRLWNGTLKPVFDGICDFLAGTFSGDWKRSLQGILNIATGIFNAIQTAIETPMELVKNIVNNAIEFIKEKFNFKWSLPKLKMPHFTISGSFSLNPLSVPSFGIDWYEKAMNNPIIMNSPTAFGINSLGQIMAGGEAGSEVVSGTETLMKMIASAVATQNENVVDAVYRVLNVLMLYLPQLANMRLVTDTGVLIGELAPGMDEALGRLAVMNERGI